MTNVINKKALIDMLALIMSICWFAVHTSAATVDKTDFFADGASVSFYDDIESNGSRTIDSVLLKQLCVYPAYKFDDGTYHVNQQEGQHAVANGPTYPFLNCTMPSYISQQMTTYGYNYFYNTLNFSMSSKNIYAIELLVDNERVVYANVNGQTGGTFNWFTPKKNHDYELIVYSNNVNVAAWGHVTV